VKRLTSDESKIVQQGQPFRWQRLDPVDLRRAIIGEFAGNALEIEQAAAMAARYAGMATSGFARSEARTSESLRCHLHRKGLVKGSKSQVSFLAGPRWHSCGYRKHSASQS
jgi:hypothetical protein